MAFDPAYYDSAFYETDAAIGVGLSLGNRVSRVWALQVALTSGFPVSYPRTFDAAPWRVSSLDLVTDGTTLGSVLHEGRILEAPVVVSSGTDEFGGVRDGETLRFRCTGRSEVSGGVNLHSWVALEHRGKPIDGWLVDLDPMTLVPTAATQAFRGEVVAMADDPATVDILVRVFDVLALTQLIPTVRVDTSWAPYAPAVGLGQVVPFGIGIGRRVRCPCIKARSFDDTLIAVTATASASTNILTVASGYDWQTGDGPLRVASTGTLPAPLAVDVDYFAIAVDQDTQLRLATTRGNATDGVAIDLTSDGTGTLTVSSGIAPNLDDHTDFVVGIGNVTVNQVWVDGETEVPEWPLDYLVMTQEYRANGYPLTTVRFQGDWSDAVVEADVLRVDPDSDGSVSLDLKFARGFQDDARGWPIGLVATDTSQLVQGTHRFGLGAWAPGGGSAALQLPPEATQMPTRSARIVWMAPPATGLDSLIYFDGCIGIWYRSSTQEIELSIAYHRQAGDPGTGEILNSFGSDLFTSWSGKTGAGSVPWGSTTHLLLRMDDVAGLVELVVAGAVSAYLFHSKPGARQFFRTALLPAVGPIWGRIQRILVSGRLFTDAENTAAFRRWNRNGPQWASELLAMGGVPVDAAALTTAAAAWGQVESGALVCDGWLTQETELRVALMAVALMRALWFTFTAAGVQIHVPTATPTKTAALGHGDALGNLVAMPSRSRASLTEAPQTLEVRFRRTREAATAGTEFGQAITRPVFPAGAVPLALELPFVDEVVAGDIVSDWLTKRLQARDQLIRCEAASEARDVAVGDTVSLAIPAMGVAWTDAEVIGRERGTHRQGISVVPFAAAAFTYTPQPLPPDPLPSLFEPLNLGTSPFLRMTLQGTVMTLEVIPADSDNLHPIASGRNNQFPVLVGPSDWQALDDNNPSTYLSYTAPSVPNTVVFTLTMESAVARPIVDITVSCDVRNVQAPGNPADLVAPQVFPPGGAQYALTQTIVGDPNFWTDVAASTTSVRRPQWTFRGDRDHVGIAVGATIPETPWTAERVNKLAWGLAASPQTTGHEFRVEEFQIRARYAVPVLLPTYTRIWRTLGDPYNGPPPESLPTRMEGFGLGPFVDTIDGQSGDQLFYWTRVYDAVGRLIQDIPAEAITVP